MGAFGVLLLAGCVSSGMKYAEFKDQAPPLAEGQGRVLFFRDRSMFGAAVQPEIQLNGEKVGTSMPGGFFIVDRPAGQYACSASTEVKRELSFSLDAGETKYIKSYPSFGVLAGRVNFELVNPSAAEPALSGLRFTGTPGADVAPAKAEVKEEAPKAVPST